MRGKNKQTQMKCMLCYILSLVPPALPPPIWCLCNAPTSSYQRQTNRSEWKTISHIPLVSYVMHPIATQHVMYVYISMFRTIKQGSTISGVFPKHFRRKKKLCQVSESFPSQLVPVKSFPERHSLKQNDWKRGPLLASLVSILPQSHPKKKTTQETHPTKICQQIIGARQHDITAITSSLHPCMRHVALHQVNGPGI